MKKKQIAIIGGGTGALMLAAELNHEFFDIHIFEKGKNLGDKFLVAGKGGLNLTHSESPDTFAEKYIPSKFIKPFFTHFNNLDTRKWFEDIGIQTMVGSSKKIYPIKGIKPIKVLKAILSKLEENKVNLHFGHEFIDLSSDFQPIFQFGNKEKIIEADIFIFAMGGASWKVTGSDGKWSQVFKKHNIKTNKFEPSNCAFEIGWKEDFIKVYQGKPVKNILTYYKDKLVKGEFVLTKFGIEGGAIYAMSAEMRNQLNETGKAKLYVDLKPEFSERDILSKINSRQKSKSLTKILKENLNLSSIKLALLKYATNKEEFLNKNILAKKIKKIPLNIIGIATLDEAISTVGGVDLNEVDTNLKLKKLSNHYVIGEMLDWDAPTGGYLLQASLSMGNYLANHLNNQISIKNG